MEAFIDNDGGDGVGDNDDDEEWLVKKGKGSSASGAIYNSNDDAETMIRFNMEDLKRAKVKREVERG